MNKTCKLCNNQYDINLFQKHRSACNNCIRIKNKENRHKKKENLISTDTKQCNQCDNILSIDNFQTNRRRCKSCVNFNNKEKRKQQNAVRYLKNKTVINEINRERYQNDEVYKINKIYKDKMKYYLEPNNDIIQYMITPFGCTIKRLKDWIKYNFSDEMSFETQGDTWHIEHVIPKCKFDILKENEQHQCFNWKNISVTNPKYNLEKNKYIDNNQIKMHVNKLLEFHKINNLEVPNIYIEQVFLNHMRDTL